MEPLEGGLSLVVPAFDEAHGLPAALEELAAAASGLGRPWEILVVDDGSRDGTAEAAREAARRRPGIRVLQNGTNLGIGGAMRRGVDHARGELVTVVPADIAFDLARLPDMIAAVGDADVLVCLRSDRCDSSSFRKLVSAVYIALVRRLFALPLRQFNFIHLYRRRIFRTVAWESNGVFFHAEVLIRARDEGYAIREFPLGYRPRRAGRAKGARLRTIARTAHDLARFWWRWRRRRPAR